MSKWRSFLSQFRGQNEYPAPRANVPPEGTCAHHRHFFPENVEVQKFGITVSCAEWKSSDRCPEESATESSSYKVGVGSLKPHFEDRDDPLKDEYVSDRRGDSQKKNKPTIILKLHERSVANASFSCFLRREKTTLISPTISLSRRRIRRQHRRINKPRGRANNSLSFFRLKPPDSLRSVWCFTLN